MFSVCRVLLVECWLADVLLITLQDTLCGFVIGLGWTLWVSILCILHMKMCCESMGVRRGGALPYMHNGTFDGVLYITGENFI